MHSPRLPQVLLLACIAMPTFANAQLADIFRAARDAANLAKQAGDAVQNAKYVQTKIQSITDVSVSMIPQAPLEAAAGDVVIYTTNWCGYCKQEIAYVKARGIPYVEKNVDRNDEHRREQLKAFPKGGVPVTVFGTQVMSGFNEAEFDRMYAAWKQAPPATGARGLPAASAVASVAPFAPPDAAVAAGEVLVAKIRGVRATREPGQGEWVGPPLAKGDEVVFLGEERSGHMKVATPAGEGWVQRAVLRKP